MSPKNRRGGKCISSLHHTDRSVINVLCVCVCVCIVTIFFFQCLFSASFSKTKHLACIHENSLFFGGRSTLGFVVCPSYSKTLSLELTQPNISKISVKTLYFLI